MSSVMFDVVLDATGPPSSSPQKAKRQLFFDVKEFIVTPIISTSCAGALRGALEAHVLFVATPL